MGNTWAMTQRERASDSDETEGRKLYRAHADLLAHAQMSIAAHPVKMLPTPETCHR